MGATNIQVMSVYEGIKLGCGYGSTLMTKKVEKKKPATITKAKPLRSKKPTKPPRHDQEKYRILVEALRHSEEKYRTLFEDSRDAITITDRDGTFLDVNKAMLDLYRSWNFILMICSFL